MKKTNRYTFTVEFDREVWDHMTAFERTEWVLKVSDLLSDEVYVTNVREGN